MKTIEVKLVKYMSLELEDKQCLLPNDVTRIASMAKDDRLEGGNLEVHCRQTCGAGNNNLPRTVQP